MKVSIDFDRTLTRPCMWKFVQNLNKIGIEVHITTSRCNGFRYGIGNYDNSDLECLADRCGIEPWNIHYTNGNFKYNYLDKGYLFHIDDNIYEIERITHIQVIDVRKSWSIRKCWELIYKEYEKRGLI